MRLLITTFVLFAYSLCSAQGDVYSLMEKFQSNFLPVELRHNGTKIYYTAALKENADTTLSIDGVEKHFKIMSTTDLKWVKKDILNYNSIMHSSGNVIKESFKVGADYKILEKSKDVGDTPSAKLLNETTKYIYNAKGDIEKVSIYKTLTGDSADMFVLTRDDHYEIEQVMMDVGMMKILIKTAIAGNLKKYIYEGIIPEEMIASAKAEMGEDVDMEMLMSMLKEMIINILQRPD